MSEMRKLRSDQSSLKADGEGPDDLHMSAGIYGSALPAYSSKTAISYGAAQTMAAHMDKINHSGECVYEYMGTELFQCASAKR